MVVVEKTQGYVDQPHNQGLVLAWCSLESWSKMSEVSKAGCLDVLKSMLPCKIYCWSGENMFGKGADKKDMEI